MCFFSGGGGRESKPKKSKIEFLPFFSCVDLSRSWRGARRVSFFVPRSLRFGPPLSLSYRAQIKHASISYAVPGWREASRTGWGTGALSRVKETIRSMAPPQLTTATTRLALRRRRMRNRIRLPRLFHQITRRSLRGSAPRRCSPQRAALLRPRLAPRPSSCGPIPIRAPLGGPLDTLLLLPLPRRRRREGPGASRLQQLLLTPLLPTSARSQPRTPRWLPRRRRPR